MCKRLALCIALKGTIAVSAQGSAGELKIANRIQSDCGAVLGYKRPSGWHSGTETLAAGLPWPPPCQLAFGEMKI